AHCARTGPKPGRRQPGYADQVCAAQVYGLLCGVDYFASTSVACGPGRACSQVLTIANKGAYPIGGPFAIDNLPAASKKFSYATSVLADSGGRYASALRPVQNDFHALSTLQHVEGFLVLAVGEPVCDQGLQVQFVVEQKTLALVPGLEHQAS